MMANVHNQPYAGNSLSHYTVTFLASKNKQHTALQVSSVLRKATPQLHQHTPIYIASLASNTPHTFIDLLFRLGHRILFWDLKRYLRGCPAHVHHAHRGGAPPIGAVLEPLQEIVGGDPSKYTCVGGWHVG